MTVSKDTLEYAESLIQNRIDDVLLEISKWSRECADHNEEFISFKQSRSEELKLLYKRLENIQQMKTKGSKMSEIAQKLYDAWEEKWLKQGDFYEERSLAAAFKELVNQFKIDYEIEEDVEDDWVIGVKDILRISEELEK
jgi:hypothetical protein